MRNDKFKKLQHEMYKSHAKIVISILALWLIWSFIFLTFFIDWAHGIFFVVGCFIIATYVAFFVPILKANVTCPHCSEPLYEWLNDDDVDSSNCPKCGASFRENI